MFDVAAVQDHVDSTSVRYERVSFERGAQSIVDEKRIGDRVELSDAALDYDRPDPASEIRSDLVEKIRALIAEDKYLTPERINGAVDHLHREVFGNNG